MILHKRYLLFVFLFLLQQSLVAQETKPLLTLSDAIDIALEQNFDIRISKLTLAQAKANNTIGNAGMLPTVSAIGSVSTSRTDVHIELASGAVQDRRGAKSLSLNGAVQMDWTLFDGFRMFVNKDRLSELEKQGVIALKSQIQSTVAQVIVAYANVVKEKQLLMSIDTAKALAYDRMELSRNKFEVGVSAKTDYLQAQVDYNASKAASFSQIAAVRNSMDSLMVLLGRNQFTNFEVEDSVTLNKDIPFEEQDGWLTNNFSVQLAELQKQLSVFDLKLANKAALPSVNLNSAMNYNRVQNDAGVSLFNRTYGPVVGLNLSMPLFDGFNINRQKKIARMEVNRQDLLLQQTKILISARYRLQYRNYQNALQTFNLEQENIKSAEENVMIQQARFRVGVANMLELREAENSYTTALGRLANVGFSLKLTETRLLELQNELVK